MQGQRSIFDPYPDTIDLNPNMDDWNMLNSHLSSDINFSCVNNSNNHHFPSLNWDVGESSSRATLQDHVHNDIGHLESSSSTIRHPHDSFLAGPQTSVSMNVNLNIGYDGNSDDDDDMKLVDFYKSGSSELQSSGLSCKRKTLETSAHPTAGGSTFFPQASRSLNMSPPLLNHVPIFRHQLPNERFSENSSHDIPVRGSVPYNNNSSTGNNPTRCPNINSTHSNQSSNRQIFLNEFLDQTSRGPVNSSSFLNRQPPSMHAPQFPWSSNIRSRTGGGGSSSLLRNNVQYHNFVPPSDLRNLVQDPTNWSLSTGNSGAPSSSRNGTRPSNALWPPHHNPTMPSQPYEFPPWTLFPPAAELESGGQRGHFSLFPVPVVSSSSSSSDDNRISAGVPSQRHHYLPFSRNGLLMEVPSEDWRSLAADIEGRQRLVSEIRQVLNAMRRGENVRAEDYMLFDPFINGVAELHDRHQDMRLDVDNMSYEELLALEERIGNVNTGLNEEVILKSMKQRKHISFMAISTKNSDPCCICQENYVGGDKIGRLDCGHDFHTDCIKQWLTQKNICPICKMPGLATCERC